MKHHADITVAGDSIEILQATLKIGADPTAAPPQWAITPVNNNSPTTWINGTWGAWASNKVIAYTPTLPGATSNLPSTDEYANLWIKFAIGVEVPIIKVGVVNII